MFGRWLTIICEVGSWVVVKKEFKGCNLNDMVMDWICRISASPSMTTPYVLDWVPPPEVHNNNKQPYPPEVKVKINFDGASFRNPRLSGYECLMCDSQGSIILAKGGPIGCCDTNHVELIGLLEGLKMLKNKGFYNCIVEGDSKVVISWGRGGEWWLLEAAALHS